MVLGLQADEEPAPVAILADGGEQMTMGDADLLGDLVDLILADDEELELLVERLPQERGEDRVLRLEVVVEAAERDVRLRGDLADGRLLDALSGEEAPRGGDETRARLGLAPLHAAGSRSGVAAFCRRGSVGHALHCTELPARLEHLFISWYGAAP